MAKHPEVREKLIANTDDSYIMQVMNEVLRMYSPSWTTDRIAIQADKLGKYQLPEGTRIVLFLYGLHHNPDIWEHPDQFDPERFSEEASSKRHAYAFLPFGAGPRMCIGRNLALLIIKTYLKNLVNNYRLVLHTQAVGVKPMVTLQPDRPVLMSLFKK